MRIATWSVAAAVLAYAGVALFLTGSASIALADVLKATEKHKLVKFKTAITFTYSVQANPQPETKVEMVYADLRAARFRQEEAEEIRGEFRLTKYSVYDRARDRRLTVYDSRPINGIGEGEKGAALVKISTFPNAGEPSKRSFSEELRHLETRQNAKIVTEDKFVHYTVVDGISTTQLWVDRTTKLPTRMVTELLNIAPGIESVVFESTEFEWDPRLNGFRSTEDLFSLTPPAGYKLEDLTKNGSKKQ